MRVKVHFDYLSTTWILAKLKCDLIGIVQPKMKLLSTFTHPHVILYDFISSARHKRRHLGPMLFCIPLTFIIWTETFKISSLCSTRKSKALVWNDMIVSK